MDILVALGVVGFVFLLLKGGMLPILSSEAGSLGTVTLTGDALRKATIRDNTVRPLGVSADFEDAAVNCLFAQYKIETASGTAWYFPTTKNLWNRHVGTGRGEWIGSGKPKSSLVEGLDFIYVSPGDPDIRCFESEAQCCRDYVELMNDPLYEQAKAGLLRGSAPDYFNALHAAGFSTQADYAQALQRTYDALA